MIIVACLEITMEVSWSNSLKDKRTVVRSLKAKIRQKFNVSVHEAGALDSRQIIQLAITTASNSKSQIHQVFDHLENFIESTYDVTIKDISTDFF